MYFPDPNQRIPPPGGGWRTPEEVIAMAKSRSDADRAARLELTAEEEYETLLAARRLVRRKRLG
jgi:hypothetical protein